MITGADFEWPSTNIRPQGAQSKNHGWTARGPQIGSEANAMSWEVGSGSRGSRILEKERGSGERTFLNYQVRDHLKQR